MARCENSWRIEGRVIGRCVRTEAVTLTRWKWCMERMDLLEEEKSVCRICAKKLTTGSQRDPSWPWRWIKE